MIRKLKISFIISYTILVIYAVVSLLPFIWAFLVSITPLNGVDPVTREKFGVDIMQWPPKINLFRIPPKVFGVNATLENYKKVFEIVPYARWFLNTVIYALSVTIGNVILDTLGGYAFARLKFPLKNFWFILFLSTMMVPFQVTMIPQYTLMVRYGLVNTYPGLIIPKLTSVFGLFLMRQFFLDFPKEVEEAAIIDGAGILKTFFRVVLPNSKPAVTTLSIYTFLGAWNDFMWPLIITSSKEMYTLTMGLNFFKTSYYTFWQYMMAATILMTIPMVIIFLSFQNQFAETERSSSIKG